MEINSTTIIIAVVGIIIVLYVIFRLTRSIKPMSEEEAYQKATVDEVNKQPTVRGKKARGGLLIFIILIILIFSWIWLGDKLHF